MGSADVPKSDDHKSDIARNEIAARAIRPAIGPIRDVLGVSFFEIHLGICAYIVFGWAVPFAPVLMFYLVFLPLVAM
nr:MAG: hypothetical protein E4H34_06400 [Hyphomicrobiales bacterium]